MRLGNVFKKANAPAPSGLALPDQLIPGIGSS